MSAEFRQAARPFLEAGLLTLADVHAVALVALRWGETDPTRMLGLAFAVRAPRVGHAGVDLGQIACQVDAERLLFASRGAPLAAEDEADSDAGEVPATRPEDLPWPDAAKWSAATFTSPMVGSPSDIDRPFVRQELQKRTLLLTRRMYREQELVANALRGRAALEVPGHARLDDLDATIDALFGETREGEAARAVRLAATRRLSIVIGGPGTGKTFSVTRLLAALLANDHASRPLVIKLAAPTGKAAVRMREAIREATAASALPHLAVNEQVRATLQALEATTLHRLLGVRPDGSTRHGPKNPVPADVIVVDEVSMVDLALMRRLVEAVHDDARLVLLGDRDQLASVEAGCVLADLVGSGTSGPLAGSVQAFTHSRRFESAPEIALIAACLQSYSTSMADVPAEPAERVMCAVDILLGPKHAAVESDPTLRVTYLGEPESAREGRLPRPTDVQLGALVLPYIAGFELLAPGGEKTRIEGYAALLRQQILRTGAFSSDAYEPRFQRSVLDALERYRVLAVHRRGPLGVVGLDQALAKRVRGFLSPGARNDGGRHWIGRPILVTENAYDLGLMNGDVGLVLPTPEGRAAVFPHERPHEVRVVALSRLPSHEGALAMTVHKSQGSQFERVALVLAGRPSPIQTRELVYTGVTRAKNQLAWLGTESELKDALERPVNRASGLDALLR